MRIGVDACCWSNQRGFGRFTRELLSALVSLDRKNHYLFFADSHTASNHTFPEGADLVVAQTHVSPTEAASATGRRTLRDVWALSHLVSRHNVDLFFFPAVYSYFPIFNRTKIIVTLHDMIADHHPQLVFPNWRTKLYWKLKQNLAVRQAHFILTVSQYSKQQILDYFHLPESRVRVISESAQPAFTPLVVDDERAQILRRYEIESDDRFVLYVGGISPHKNLKTLVMAFHRLLDDLAFANVKLVLAGDYRHDSFYSAYPSLKQLIEQLHRGDQVIFAGHLGDQELVCMYNAASCLVMPSFEEGFGLPAMEAMACGTPVVSSDLGSLPEILGEAGRYFDPYQPESLHQALRETLSNPRIRESMRQLGLKRAKQFSWEKSANDLVAIFQEAEDA